MPFSTQDTCVICIGPYETGQQLRLLPCGHDYHDICIDKWLKARVTYLLLEIKLHWLQFSESYYYLLFLLFCLLFPFWVISGISLFCRQILSVIDCCLCVLVRSAAIKVCNQHHHYIYVIWFLYYGHFDIA